MFLSQSAIKRFRMLFRMLLFRMVWVEDERVGRVLVAGAVFGSGTGGTVVRESKGVLLVGIAFDSDSSKLRAKLSECLCDAPPPGPDKSLILHGRRNKLCNNTGFWPVT